MAAYYNEIDPYAAQWLRNLIAAGHIAPGDVDERSILDVKASDIAGYTQCHFFAGIGGWSYALRIAGWDDDRPVWTGSCPCQPFSSAGKQKGHGDERNLWPHWLRLIRERKPSAIFGEQVAGAIAFGWLDEVFDGLEKEAYSCAAAVLPACSVGAPHKRYRVFFVGIADGERREPRESASQASRQGNTAESASGNASFMADSTQQPERKQTDQADAFTIGRPTWNEFGNSSEHASDSNGQSQERTSIPRGECDFWESESGICRVADGIPARAHKLRAYGNAIVPALAAEFIKAAMGAMK